MTTQFILSNIEKHIKISEGEKQLFVSLLQSKKVNKRAFILQEGQFCEHLNFVNSGTLRAYYLGKGGKESTVMFAIKDWWITDMNCFANHLPAMLHIEAVEDSAVLQLSKKNLDQLLEEAPKFEKFFRIIFQKAYIREQLRVIQNLSQTAEERYHLFVEKYPQIFKQVKQKQIASYLGITPEFLSAIRAKRN